MRNIKLIVVGKIKEEYYRLQVKEEVDRLKKRYNVNLIELADESIPKNAKDVIMENIKEKEGNRILDNIDKKDYVIALCIEGKMTDSDMLNKVIEKARDMEYDSVVFVIGGSLGLSQKVVNRANYKLSFSKMTFPHQLMRVMLLEELANNLR